MIDIIRWYDGYIQDIDDNYYRKCYSLCIVTNYNANLDNLSQYENDDNPNDICYPIKSFYSENEVTEEYNKILAAIERDVKLYRIQYDVDINLTKYPKYKEVTKTRKKSGKVYIDYEEVK